MGFTLVLVSRNLTNQSRLSKQDDDSGHITAVAADNRGFHPSTFSSRAHEDMTELTTDPSNEPYDEPRELPCSVSHLTYRTRDDICASRRSGEERQPETILCPFYGCNFRHLVDYTKQTLECEGSWKSHILNVHWPEGSCNWEVCRWDCCGLPQNNRSSAWKHLAVHVKEFYVKCSLKGCFVYFSRGDRVSQHIRETHMGQKRSYKT